MFPVGDDQVAGGPPKLVTVALIALNVLAFLLELGQGSEGALQSFIQAWGVVPQEYTTGHDIAPLIPLPFWSTLLTSMFLHGSWLHLIANMWALWIFGDNIEDYLGHGLYLLFYLLSGVAASALHTIFNVGSTVPSVGASGAIAGVMGAYFLLYPAARVLTLVPFFFVFFVRLPAWVVLGYWFVAQFLSGAATMDAIA